MAKWAVANSRFFTQIAIRSWRLTRTSLASGVQIRPAKFFDEVLADLRSKDAEVIERARRLLDRYVPIGPGAGDADAWDSWWEGESAICFRLGRGRLSLVHRSPCKETQACPVVKCEARKPGESTIPGHRGWPMMEDSRRRTLASFGWKSA